MILFANNGFSKILLSDNFTKKDIKNIIIKNSKLTKYVSPSLGLAVAKMESNYNHKAVSSKGAIGVMQIMPLTAKKLYGIDINDLCKKKTLEDGTFRLTGSLTDEYYGDYPKSQLTQYIRNKKGLRVPQLENLNVNSRA